MIMFQEAGNTATGNLLNKDIYDTLAFPSNEKNYKSRNRELKQIRQTVRR